MNDKTLQEKNLVSALKFGLIDFPRFLELYKKIETEQKIKLRPATELIKEALEIEIKKAS